MIYPTRFAIVLALVGAPAALLSGLVLNVWPVAAGWSAFVALLVVVDARLSASRRRLEMEVRRPQVLSVGGSDQPLDVALRFSHCAPKRAELAIAVTAVLGVRPARCVTPINDLAGSGRFWLHGERRGEGLIDRIWVRWTGPLGLAYKQQARAFAEPIAVTPDLEGAKADAIRLFSRDAAAGEKMEFDRGEGSEYQSLREFEAGMDTRTIDWRQSARHNQLLAKEFRTERNHPIYVVIDTGRLMCEPLDGAPKIDRALNAALLLGYAGLKVGDRVGLFAFDARPRLFSKAAAGLRAFPALQAAASRIAYSDEESNYTLGLTTLSGGLDRRALLVVFTEFADTINAELMLDALTRLAKRHLVLFVVFRDVELQAFVDRRPETSDDVSRAVVADALLKDRRVVLTRLRRLGVEILETSPEGMGAALVDRYFSLKRRGRL
jgi:uncharacterized protein (DUF58 family)